MGLLHSSGPQASAAKMQVVGCKGASASNEILSLLHPVGTLAGLLLTQEPLDLRHPFCLALLVPALETAKDAEPDEGQKAEGASQHDSQEHWLVLVQPSG